MLARMIMTQNHYVVCAGSIYASYLYSFGVTLSYRRDSKTDFIEGGLQARVTIDSRKNRADIRRSTVVLNALHK